MLANPLPEERRVFPRVRQRGFAFLLRLLLLVLAQQIFPFTRVVGDSTPIFKASSVLTGFLLASQSVQAQTPDITITLSATAGDGQVTLSWNTSRAHTTSEAITGWSYVQKKGTGNYGDYQAIPGGESKRSHTVTGLENGSQYTFKVIRRQDLPPALRGVVPDELDPFSSEVSATPVATAGVTLSKSELTVNEGSTGVYTVKLATDPGGTVTVSPTSADPGAASVSPSSLTFTSSTYSTAQTVTVTGESDTDTTNETVNITHGVSGYGSVTSGGTVTVTVTDTTTPVSTPKPAKPTGLSASAGAGQVDLSWDDPSDSSITKYQVRLKKGSGAWGSWTDIPSSGATTTSHRVSGLDNGKVYSFQIRAVNGGGNSLKSNTAKATPESSTPKPGAPSGFSASRGDGSVTLSWGDPSDNSITKYQVRRKKGSGAWGGWTDIAGSGSSTTGHTVSGLDNGSEYSFQVRAVNNGGNGAVSATVEETPRALSAPVISGQAGDSSVILSWEDIEGEEITGWWYQYKSGGGWGGNIAVAGNARSVLVRGLSNDTAYTFRMFARAGARQSGYSNEVTSTPTSGASASVVISTPSLTVTEGSAGTYRTGSYTVALSAPPSSETTVSPSIGTNPATAMIQLSPSALTFNSSNYNVPQPVTVTPVRDVDTSGTTSPITVSHSVSPAYGSNDDLSVSVTVEDTTPTLQLTTDPEDVQEGDSIRLTVSASRAFSGSLPVRLSLSARDSSGFNASDIPGGLGPREFTVEFGASGSTTGTVTISTSRDANTAEGDEAYEIRLEDATDNCCYAVGSDRTAEGTLNDGPAPPSSGGGGGSSSPSEESEEEEQEPPAKPTGFTVTPGNGQVTLSWSDPSDATISKWQVQCKRADGSYGSWMDIPDASTTGYTISGLTNGVSYECRIRAVNGAGPGPASDVVVVTPTDPDAARAARAREGVGVGISRATLSGATDVIGGRSTGAAAPAPTTASSSSIGEQALGIVEELLGINGTALPTSLSMEAIGEQLWHQAFQLTPPPVTSAAADGERAQADDSPAVQQRNWALWGAGNLQRFSGDDAQENSSYEGNLKSAWVGIDQQFRTPWRGGIAASFSFGTTDYSYERTSGEGAGGTMKSRLTSFYPYGSVQVNERLRLWGTAGLGFGELRHQESSTGDTDIQQEQQEGDLRMQLAVVGFAQQLSSIGTWDFALAGDLGLIKTSSQWPDHSGLEDLSMTLTRARLGVDSSFPLSESTRGYVNLRGRLDGGEQQMGAAEAVAGLQYSAARLSALLQGRQTYAFNGDYSESGIMGQLLFSSQEDGTGLALELQPSYGHYGDVNAQQPFFFDDDQLQALTGQSTSQQDEGLGLKSMLGYGFRPHDADLLLTPFAELSFSQGRRYLLGVGLSMEAPPWEVKLTGSREEAGSSSPTGKVQLLFSTQL